MDQNHPKSANAAADEQYHLAYNGESHTRSVKRVPRACERCRNKKSKCDGRDPCQRCRMDNVYCTFNERKRSAAPRGLVESLQQEQGKLYATIENMYMEMVRREVWPWGLVYEHEGKPSIHAIIKCVESMPRKARAYGGLKYQLQNNSNSNGVMGSQGYHYEGNPSAEYQGLAHMSEVQNETTITQRSPIEMAPSSFLQTQQGTLGFCQTQEGPLGLHHDQGGTLGQPPVQAGPLGLPQTLEGPSGLPNNQGGTLGHFQAQAGTLGHSQGPDQMPMPSQAESKNLTYSHAQNEPLRPIQAVVDSTEFSQPQAEYTAPFQTQKKSPESQSSDPTSSNYASPESSGFQAGVDPMVLFQPQGESLETQNFYLNSSNNANSLGPQDFGDSQNMESGATFVPNPYSDLSLFSGEIISPTAWLAA